MKYTYTCFLAFSLVLASVVSTGTSQAQTRADAASLQQGELTFEPVAVQGAQADGFAVGVNLTAYKADGFWDRDDERQDGNGTSFRKTRVMVKGSYPIGNYNVLGIDSAGAKVFGGVTYGSAKWKFDDDDGDDEVTGSALENVFVGVTLGGALNDKLRVGGLLGGYIDTEGEPDTGDTEVGERQSAFRMAVRGKYAAAENVSVRAVSDYLFRFDGETDSGFSYNEGNACLFALGGMFHTELGGNPFTFGVDVIARARGKRSFDGNSQDESEGRLLGIAPHIKGQFGNIGVRLGGPLDANGRVEPAYNFSGRNNFDQRGLVLGIRADF